MATPASPDFFRLHDHLRIALVHRPRRLRGLILDWDTTVLTVYGKREGAAIGYNPKKHGRPSYVALLCIEGQTRDCWEASYHPGDTHPASVIIPALERAFAKAPPDVRTIRMRADQAFYDHKVIEFLEAKRAFYAIPARLYASVKMRVLAARYRRASAGVEAAEFRYQPLKWPGPRRFIAIRRPAPEEPSWQLTLWKQRGYVYQVIVTNLDLSALNVWRFYNNRSQAELVIRELKEAYAMGKIPTRSWNANVAYFQLVVFAYNALNWFKRLCVVPEWERLSLQTLRHRLLLIPAELVRPQGHATLKMPTSYQYQRQFCGTLARIARFRFKLNPALAAPKSG